jgi:Mn2+/Fe2+ NRAMP family transporter
VVLAIPVPWPTVIQDTFLPTISLSPAYVATVVAIFGTTISPYLFFWQASQEVEERRIAYPEPPTPDTLRAALRHVRNDTALGMGISCVIAFFIMLTTALTLNAHGTTDIQTSAQAAEALRPVAGNFAFVLFALGMVGTGMLAVPVLAASAAYAAADTFKIPGSLGNKPREAFGFYAIITVATLGGAALDFTAIGPLLQRHRQRCRRGAADGCGNGRSQLPTALGKLRCQRQAACTGMGGHGRHDCQCGGVLCDLAQGLSIARHRAWIECSR